VIFLNYFLVFFILFPSLCVAADPPMYQDYKQKVVNNIDTAWKNTDQELEGPVTSLSSSVVYYDATRVGWGLEELDPVTFYDVVENYIHKQAEITARTYISYTYPPSGYTVFPHGIYREWIRTGNTRFYHALEDLHSCKTDISDTNGYCVPNSTYTKVAYARELAYQIHTKIYAEKAGIASDGYLGDFLDYALSMLDQWHTGNITDPDFQVRQSFMAGLLLSSVIEYYEQVNQDPRIPPAVKETIDDLWSQAWWPDLSADPPSDHGDTADYSGMTPGYGAFMYWMNWNADHYEWEPNHMANSADVSPDLNNLIGPAYMWYALYSGDNDYRVKAEKIWEGWVANGFANYDKQFNQGSREVYNFVRWYNEYTGDACDNAHPWLCKTKATCESNSFSYFQSECTRTGTQTAQVTGSSPCYH